MIDTLMAWLPFIVLSFLEYVASIYYYESLLKRRFGKGVTYLVFYIAFIVLGLVSSWFAAVKAWMLTAGFIIIVLALYQTTIRTALFFSTLYLSVLWSDIMILVIMPRKLRYDATSMKPGMAVFYLGAKILAIIFVVIIVRVIEPAWKIRSYDNRIWKRFLALPIAQIVVFNWVYREYLNGNDRPVEAALYLVIFMLEIIAFKTVQEVIIERDNLREASLREQKLLNEIEASRDMDLVLAMQRKHLHDYKNQIRTIGNLIRNGKADEAEKLTNELSEGLNAAASIVSTKNAAFDAILNQKYTVAKSKGIGMSLMVGDLSGVRLTSSEIVCVTGNLLDNAIKESEKVLDNGGNASVRVKISNEKELIMIVRNPVVSKVPIEDNKVLREHESGHGIGLTNVEEIAGKYDGSFGIVCDEKVFTASLVI